MIQTILAFAVIAGLGFLHWKKAARWLLYWMILAGAVRKWLFPGSADAVVLASHILLLGVYARMLTNVGKRKTYTISSAFLAYASLLILWCIVSIFNPELPSIQVGLLGFLIHCFYIPLVFVIPETFSSKQDMLAFLRRYVYFSIPVLLLGAYQFFSPATSAINSYVGSGGDIAMVGSHVRVTGTFSYITGYTAYLSVLILLIVYLLTVVRGSIKANLLIFGIMVLAVMNLFMTGSRGAVLMGALQLALYFLISSGLGGRILMRWVLRGAVIAVLFTVFFGLTDRGATIYAAFMDRLSRVGDVQGRVLDAITPFQALDQGGMAGKGIGLTYQGAQRFVDATTRADAAEAEAPRVMLELGLFGYLLVYGLRLMIVIQLWMLYRRLKDRDLRLLALCACLFTLQFMHFNTLVYNLTSGAYYWFLTGFLFLLPKLERIQNEQRNARAVAIPRASPAPRPLSVRHAR